MFSCNLLHKWYTRKPAPSGRISGIYVIRGRYVCIVFLCCFFSAFPLWGQTAKELQKYLTQREKVQSAEEMEEHFPAATVSQTIGDNQEYQTFYRFSVAGKQQQLWERVLATSLLAVISVALRVKGLFQKR